jgi:sporulation protein YlmC with PRC-barrel domain
MDANLLKNRMVVSMDGGASLGSVEDVLFDTEQLRVAALVLRHDGARAILPFEAVQHIGAEEITATSVDSAETERAEGSLNLMRSLGDLVGLRVLNGEAKYLGDVRSLTIDDETGSLTELEAHSGGMLGLGRNRTVVPVSAIRGIGDDFVTAEMSAMGAS